MKKLIFNEIIVLKGQHSLSIPVEEGINNLQICVMEGKIRINHGAYTPNGGTWLSKPIGRPAHYDFQKGDTQNIQVNIKKSFSKTDKLSIINVSFFHKAVFRITK